MNVGKLFVISGPSGSGKTTIVKATLGKVSNLLFSVSCTTRIRRQHEKEGVDYKFIDHDRFMQMIDRGEFLEWSEVHGKLYGTPETDIISMTERGYDVILDIDVKGASEIKKNFQNSVFIFILPESMEQLGERLRKRRSETNPDIDKRIETARNEIEQISNYDYIIINNDIDNSVDTIASIIKAERCRTQYVIDYVRNKYRFI